MRPNAHRRCTVHRETWRGRCDRVGGLTNRLGFCNGMAFYSSSAAGTRGYQMELVRTLTKNFLFDLGMSLIGVLRDEGEDSTGGPKHAIAGFQAFET